MAKKIETECWNPAAGLVVVGFAVDDAVDVVEEVVDAVTAFCTTPTPNVPTELQEHVTDDALYVSTVQPVVENTLSLV